MTLEAVDKMYKEMFKPGEKTTQGVQKFRCEDCDKGFANAKSLRNHKNTAGHRNMIRG